MHLHVIKTAAILLLVFSFYFSRAQELPANQLKVPDKTCTIPFIWKGDSINGQWDEHAAMLIPVKFINCPYTFYMQFDLGSPYSLFYTNKMAAISARYPKTIRATDTTTKLSGFQFSTGDMKILAKEIFMRPLGNSTVSWAPQYPEIVGTLGVDLIDDRQVLIDYPGKRIVINYHSKHKPELADLYYSGKRILFPSSIRGKQSILYFDTGSSAFELLTDKETVLSLASPGAVPVKYNVSSWGRALEATSMVTGDSITIAFNKIPINKATYIEGASDVQVKQMMKMGIGGMTGNKLFLRSLLFLDLKNKKFSVVPGKLAPSSITVH